MALVRSNPGKGGWAAIILSEKSSKSSISEAQIILQITGWN